MENKKTALENIDAAIEVNAALMAGCTSAECTSEFAKVLDSLYQLRVHERGRLRIRRFD